tara:strand:- start:10500 stop:13268 length:2769 start_codon:yes stop_codon:yes gene_type:complete
VAVAGKEVEILGVGTTPIQYSNGAFALNMLYRKGGFEARKGFGQRAEYTCTFGTRFFDEGGSAEFSAKPQGFLMHLGSHLYRTEEYRQILSVFAAAFLPCNTQVDQAAVNGYLVEIYDIDRDVRWEEAIYPQTGQSDRATIPIPEQHGIYETARGESYIAFEHGRIEPFFFTEHEDMLFFGSEAAGVLFYKPTSFRERKIQQLNNTFFRATASSQFSETSVIRRIDPMKGTYENQLAFEYLSTNTFNGIRDMASMGFSTVAAAGNALYFSDDESPFAFTTENIVPIPTKFKVLAIEEVLGNLLIWTESETWHYTPSQGQVKSAGRLTKISDLIGCVGPQAVTKLTQGLAWVDRNGIYATQNGLQHQAISAPIKSFFNEFITNPVTNYYQASGFADLTNQQPNSFYRFSPKMVNLAHSPDQDIIIASFPGENIALTLTQQRWSVWTFESNVFVQGGAGGVSEVGAKENISNAYIVADAEGLFAVGSVQSQSITDAAKTWNTGSNQFDDVNDDVEARSYYILEYGRGGSIDRSVDDEDYREPRGQYTPSAFDVTAFNYLWDKWVKMPVGFTFPAGTAVTAAQDVFLVPISVFFPVAGTTNALDFSFTFDSANWEPIVRSAVSAEVDIILPAERLPVAVGFGSPGAQVAGASEVRVYSLPGGAVNSAGQEIRISFSDGASGGPAGTPSIRRVAHRKIPLLYIPMRRKNMTVEVSGMGLAKGSVAPAGNWIFWEQQCLGSLRHAEDNVAQPVDWAYKSVQIGLDTPVRLKARGLFVQMLSHGKGVAADYLEPNWIWGVFNTLLAGDFRGWTSQIIDYAGTITGSNQIERITDKQNIRARIIDSNSLLVNKTFNQAGVTYGDPASAARGAYLIDDEEMNIMATSDGTKGQTITYMVFGHLQNRAQKIHIDSIKAVLREVGGRRRFGR